MSRAAWAHTLACDAAWQPTPEECVVQAEMRRDVRMAVRALLPGRKREIVETFFGLRGEGHETIASAARALGVSPSCVHTHVQHARQRMGGFPNCLRLLPHLTPRVADEIEAEIWRRREAALRDGLRFQAREAERRRRIAEEKQRWLESAAATLGCACTTEEGAEELALQSHARCYAEALRLRAEFPNAEWWPDTLAKKRKPAWSYEI